MQKIKDVLKFRLEFMILMLNSGRQEEANAMLQQLLATIDTVEGYVHSASDEETTA
jgi:hypothetical protein